MSNDPKDTFVDLSKLTLEGIPVCTRPSLITTCNEGANLMSKDSPHNPLIGFENFSKIKFDEEDN